jgi:hypothetical protein
MSFSQWQREGWTIDDAWDVLSIAKGRLGFRGGVESGGGAGGQRSIDCAE